MVVRVVLVDDESLIRAGLRSILDGTQGIEIVGEAADGGEAIAVIEASAPDVVLMDIHMPKLDGIRALRGVFALASPPRVLMLTTFDTEQLILDALRGGASGFLVKDTPPKALVSAVLATADGQHTLSSAVLDRVLAVGGGHDDAEVRDRARHLLDGLTERERDVAMLVALGESNAEISRHLFLSLATVKTHLSRVFDKLDCRNRVQVALCVRDAQLR